MLKDWIFQTLGVCDKNYDVDMKRCQNEPCCRDQRISNKLGEGAKTLVLNNETKWSKREMGGWVDLESVLLTDCWVAK
jgi:hypothetical protein